MQQPSKLPPGERSLREDLVDALAETVVDVVARLQPVTRLRLLAFMHLFENPETIRAVLDIEATGAVRLTLAQRSDGERRH